VSKSNQTRHWGTYIAARVAVGADVRLATAELTASVLLPLADGLTTFLGDLVGAERAARDGRAVGSAVGQQLGRSASEGRGGDDESREEHG